MVVLSGLFILPAASVRAEDIYPEGGIMRAYEAVFVFRPEEELYKQGIELVKNEFSRSEVTITKEEDVGTRDLAYPVKKETRGHYYFFEAQIDPFKINDMSKAVKLMDPVLRHLFIKKQ
ncbi:MAG: 30S ribosomal protein S6 [Spirochaetales bacterium]|nr:30S ribosomal protein S6 [Spirochaetales bacterium]